ncbi:sensor histidine kinase [Paracrocinitomix mangrovi]|uniref:sensor histidine kinase n=1 Tax=Paracrocinitomix mangrovi TaxID=2862509 RepID=UPI001C8F0491|nr:sensor histidine kinase [Paracrocinitomix mangrovi]UKN02253.1 sensor histidine kinase [Paracrocinitomix mangrovi]
MVAERGKIPLAIVVSGIIFSIDLLLPLGIAGGVPYVIVILILSFENQSNIIWTAATVTSILNIIGFFLSPKGGELYKVISNRLLALFVIWSTAIIVFRLLKTRYNLKIEKERMKERELMIQEVHHRVKNNLQVIDSLANLQIDYSKNETVKMELKSYTSRVLAISKIHELLYRRPSENNLNMAEYIIFLFDYYKSVFQEMNKIKISMDLDEIELGVEKAANLGLVINEILTNAIRHGLEETSNPELNIKMKKSSAGINIFISDNGVGFDPQSPEFNKGLGSDIIYGIIKQLSGEISCTNSSGTQYTIRIPAT